MRALILVAGAALAVSACNRDGAADNVVNADEELAAQNISANDTTAIDAVTGDAANMAADVNFTVNETDNAAGDGNATGNATRNATGNTTGNATDNATGNAADSATGNAAGNNAI